MEAPGAGQLAKKKLTTWAMRAALLEGEQHILVEKPKPLLSVITINRPEVKNVMSHRTRAQIFNQLQVNDQDPDVRVTIIKGAGGVFSAGHDFDSNRDEVLPFFEPDIDGQTARHILHSFFMLNDLAKPVIAMVEGEAIGGGFELAAACDVCICADDAILGYNAVRGQGLADYQILPWMCGMRNAMELILTNIPMTGIEAAKRRFVTESVPAAELEDKTFNFAERVAKIPSDLLAFNKKSVHRAYEAMGMRTNLRNTVDLEAVMFKAAGAKMITARRGPAAQQKSAGASVPQRTPPPRPTPMPPQAMSTPQAVAVQAVSATSKPNSPVSGSPAEAKKVAPVATPTRPLKSASVVAKTEDTAEDVLEKPNTVTTPVAVSPSAKPAAPAVSKTSTPQRTQAAPSKAAPTSAAKATTSKAPPTAVAKAAPATPTKTATPATPVKSPQKSTEAVTPLAKAAPVSKSNDSGVHVHLHEAVHITINGGASKTPSKL